MPKLLQINSTANWGSTGKIAEQIGERAMAHGWESYIAYGRYSNHSNSNLIRIGSRIGQAWHLIISRLFDKHGLGSRCATKKLISKIEKIKPDIIHLHNIHGYYINYRILFEYLNSTNIPVVWTLHDCWSFTGHCAHFVSANCMRWRDGMCEKCPLKGNYPKSFADSSTMNFRLKQRLFASNPNIHIVAVSKWLAEQTKQSYLGHQNIRYIYNGVDTSLFIPQDPKHIVHKYELDGKTILLGVASAWDDDKGLSDYIVLRKKLSDRYVIIIVGLAEEKINKLPKGIIGISLTQSINELVEFYSVADIVLSLSRAETFGLTIAEGMACGTPAVVYNNTAQPELITHDTGLIVEKTGDIDGVICAIKEIEKKGKAHYSEACRKRVEAHFNKNKCYLQYIELYKEIIK